MNELQSRWFYYQLQIVNIMPDYKKSCLHEADSFLCVQDTN